jgi:signal transduction histidine kinase
MRLPLDNINGIEQFRQGKVYEVKDFRLLAQPTAVEQTLGKEGIQSALGVPLFTQDDLIGVLYIGANNAQEFESHEVKIAEEVATLVAIAMQQRWLHERVRQRAQQLEQEVLARTSELREREKLAATGRMAARIAHEINNPLAGIKNAFRLIKGAVPIDHPHVQYVSRIDKEIDRIAVIVQQIFDLYRPELETPRTFRFDAAIQDIVALLESSCRQYGVRISLQMQPRAAVLNLPEGAVRQVLFNLLVNAIEASPQGGNVEVQVEFHDEYVKIEVSDQGKGIPQAIQSQIFEPFFTTKDGTSRRGLGLGLSISKSLVEAMNGRIEFRSRPEAGMSFQVLLPPRLPRQEDKTCG